MLVHVILDTGCQRMHRFAAPKLITHQATRLKVLGMLQVQRRMMMRSICSSNLNTGMTHADVENSRFFFISHPLFLSPSLALCHTRTRMHIHVNTLNYLFSFSLARRALWLSLFLLPLFLLSLALLLFFALFFPPLHGRRRSDSE